MDFFEEIFHCHEPEFAQVIHFEEFRVGGIQVPVSRFEEFSRIRGMFINNRTIEFDGRIFDRAVPGDLHGAKVGKSSQLAVSDLTPWPPLLKERGNVRTISP
jgi:hypothetical protein